MRDKKFNYSIDRENLITYYNQKNIYEMNYDIHFELNSNSIQKETIQNYDNILNKMVLNRTYIFDTMSVLFFNSSEKKPLISPELRYLFNNYIIRMIKASKIIQDLALKGNYIEANSLMRSNYERFVHICFFNKYPNKVKEFLIAKKEKDVKVLKKYSIRKMFKESNLNYEDYKYLCHFVHPSLHVEDTSNFDIDSVEWIFQTNYPSKDYTQFKYLTILNNNLLVEAFLIVRIPFWNLFEEKEIIGNLREVKDLEKKICIIKLKPPKNIPKQL